MLTLKSISKVVDDIIIFREMCLRATYQSRISENHKVDLHKDKFINVQTDKHGPKIDGL